MPLDKTLPHLSVVMSAYNSADTIQQAIDSILSQTYCDFEFLIIDDGSKDDTRHIIESYADSRICRIYNEKNIGLTASLNKAILQSKGEFIARQDADDISMPERLSRQVEFLENHKDIVLLGTARATIDRAGKVIAQSIMPTEPTFESLLQSNHFVHGSVMMRKWAIEEVGFYNECFRQSQDYELWLRLARHYRVMNLSDVLYGVRRHDNRVTLNKLENAILFKLMAADRAQNLVSDEVLREVKLHGPDVYYELLTSEKKINFHKRAARKYFSHKRFEQAVEHLKRITQLSPTDIVAWLQLVWAMIRRKTPT